MSRQGPSSMLPRPGMTSFTWQAGAAPRTPSPPVSRSPASRFRRPICPRPATLRRPARSLSWVAWCFWPQASSWAVAADSRSRHLGAGAASHCRGEGASQLMPPPPLGSALYCRHLQFGARSKYSLLGPCPVAKRCGAYQILACGQKPGSPMSGVSHVVFLGAWFSGACRIARNIYEEHSKLPRGAAQED